MPAVRLTVRVQPRASRAEIGDFDATGVLKLRVTAPPVGGAANEAVIELLAQALRLPESRVSVIRGAASRMKIVEIEGLDETDVRSRVRQRQQPK